VAKAKARKEETKAQAAGAASGLSDKQRKKQAASEAKQVPRPGAWRKSAECVPLLSSAYSLAFAKLDLSKLCSRS